MVPYVNHIAIMACTLSFVLGLPPEPFAFVPAYFFGTVDLAGPLPAAAVWRGLFGHVLIHGDIGHLVSNMLALWAFGGVVEEATGHLRYALFLALCAAAGALVEGALAPDPMVPLVGASGAICGVMGAFLLLRPHADLQVPRLLRVPAALVVGAFLVVNVVMTLIPPAPGSDLAEVAWAAHLGGFAAGMALMPILRRPGVVLLPVGARTGTAGGAMGGPFVGDRLTATAKAAVYLTLVFVLLRTL